MYGAAPDPRNERRQVDPRIVDDAAVGARLGEPLGEPLFLTGNHGVTATGGRMDAPK